MKPTRTRSFAPRTRVALSAVAVRAAVLPKSRRVMSLIAFAHLRFGYYIPMACNLQSAVLVHRVGHVSGSAPRLNPPGARVGFGRSGSAAHRDPRRCALARLRFVRASAAASHIIAVIMPVIEDLLVSPDRALFNIRTQAPGPQGSLPLTPEMLLQRPSGDLFGLSMDAGMGWTPSKLGAKEFLILSTQGGIRNPDGSPVALGYHTGHWEVGLLMQAAAEELKAQGFIPFAGFVTDPCD